MLWQSMHLQIYMKALVKFCGEASGKPRDIQEFCAPIARKKIEVLLVLHKYTNFDCCNF